VREIFAGFVEEAVVEVTANESNRGGGERATALRAFKAVTRRRLEEVADFGEIMEEGGIGGWMIFRFIALLGSIFSFSNTASDKEANAVASINGWFCALLLLLLAAAVVVFDPLVDCVVFTRVDSEVLLIAGEKEDAAAKVANGARAIGVELVRVSDIFWVFFGLCVGVFKYLGLFS
jgi:hypothetical protein